MKTALATLVVLTLAVPELPQQRATPTLTEPEQELVALCDKMYLAFDAYYKRAETLQDDTERTAYLRDDNPLEIFVQRLQEFAEAHHGTHAGLMAIRRLILLAGGGGEHGGPGDCGRQFALSKIADYGKSPELPELIRYLDSGNTEPSVVGALQTLIASKDVAEENRIFARYMLARWTLTQLHAREHWERRLKELDGGDELRFPNERSYYETSLEHALPAAELGVMERGAVASLEALSKSRANVRQPGVRGVDKDWMIIRVDAGKTPSMPLVSELAAGLLFKHNHLSIGKPAPELEVSLVNGQRWSLAQQRGKAVIIQFSFKGCGPCEAMYPELRELQASFPDSLSILSIMADGERDITEAAVESGKLTWDVCWDSER